MSTPDPAFERLLEYVRDARGFDYTGYRRPTLIRRFERRLQAVGAGDWEAYRAHLEKNPEEFGELFNTILINVTGFFRDRETWDVVASDVIPQLLEQKQDGQAIRIWSAGCASGEEPYTVAMLLAEALGEDEFRRRVKIYATDVDEEALAEAREASFTPKELEKVPPDLRKRYFQSANNHGSVFRNDLRRIVIFGRNDLHRDPPISRVDLLVSRNTLMYFGADSQERILANFYFALNRGGFLVVGKAEALQSGRAYFAPYDLKRRIFRKDGEGAFHVARLPAPLLAPEEPPAPRDLGGAAFELGPMAQIVIDDQNRVAAVNQTARTMFSIRPRDVGRELTHLEVSYRPVELRSLVEEVRATKQAVTRHDVRWLRDNREPVVLEVELAPISGPGEQFAGVIVSFVDATGRRALEDDLERSRRDLESAYAELQSTVEELETMNEELQSTNEELETMNDELRDRTDETLRGNAFLASVLASIHQAVVVVDRSLGIIAWSHRATDLFGLRDDEVEGEHLLNLDVGVPLQRLRDPVRQVLAGAELAEAELEGHDRRGKPVLVRVAIAPLHTRADASEADGAILLLTAERPA